MTFLGLVLADPAFWATLLAGLLQPFASVYAEKMIQGKRRPPESND
jgi:hypothetical protein